VAGDSLTIADLHMSSWMEYVRMMQIDLTPYQNVQSWMTRCTSRPTYAAAP
jgi:glutathione S-transferase